MCSCSTQENGHSSTVTVSMCSNVTSRKGKLSFLCFLYCIVLLYVMLKGPQGISCSVQKQNRNQLGNKSDASSVKNILSLCFSTKCFYSNFSTNRKVVSIKTRTVRSLNDPQPFWAALKVHNVCGLKLFALSYSSLSWCFPFLCLPAVMGSFEEGERTQSVSQGEGAVIPAPRIRSFPQPQVTWYRDGRKIPPSSRM